MDVEQRRGAVWNGERGTAIECELPHPVSDPGPYDHLKASPFRRVLPGLRETREAEFADHRWQATNAVTTTRKLREMIGDLVPDSFYLDVDAGLARAPMSMRITPYVLALIEWSQPYDDPLRIQYIPVGSRCQDDHPELRLDSLGEQKDSPVPGVVHRYVDRALFLALDICPVYCRCCTRSYAVGMDTVQVSKLHLSAHRSRWEAMFRYIASNPEIEDVVVSGGDAYQLKADQLLFLGEGLLSIAHVRRIRFGTVGLAIMPQKILTDDAWVDALTRVTDIGRRHHKEVALHTQVNCTAQLTGTSKSAFDRLFERGIRVRNQSVLQRGVNDRLEDMLLLIRSLGHCNVQPYYVYVHDLVKGVEDLRTTLQCGIDLEKRVRGTTAGFNTPAFVVDMPDGGGKRIVSSFEHYDRATGISVYTAPAVKPGFFLYFDPVHSLSAENQARWKDDKERKRMVAAALAAGDNG